MRHRMRGRTLGRSPSHRRALLRNLACNLIRSVRVDVDDNQKPKVPGRIVTTVPKAKELRPYVEKLVTLARKAAEHESRAQEFASSAKPDSDEWRRWRQSEQWNQWNQAVAPAVALRRRAFSQLRDKQAVEILFEELAAKFLDRAGGYTRIVRLADFRLGDGTQKAFIEFVGEHDRVKSARRGPLATEEEAPETESATEPVSAAESERPEEQAGTAETSQSEGEAQTSDAEAASGESDEGKTNR